MKNLDMHKNIVDFFTTANRAVRTANDIIDYCMENAKNEEIEAAQDFLDMLEEICYMLTNDKNRLQRFCNEHADEIKQLREARFSN